MFRWLFLVVGFFSALWGEGKSVLFHQGDLEEMLGSYSEEERELVKKDYTVIEGLCFEGRQARTHRPRYVATAGAPGARKSTILEHLIKEDPRFSQAVYVDPDQRALKFMVHTFYARSLTVDVVSRNNDYAMVQKAAYDKWRPGSNYIACSILEKALRGRYDIAHGTTMTGPFVSRVLSALRDEGYHITLALCGCEEGVRLDAIDYRTRVQGFYQTDPDDVTQKGKLFLKRMPLYFKFADEMRLYWSDVYDEREKLAAVFSSEGIKIVDKGAYASFQNKYEKDRAQLLREENLDLPRWNELVRLWRA